MADSSHDYGKETQDEDYEKEETDPHTWLSIENAIAQSEAIKEAFIKLMKRMQIIMKRIFNHIKRN